MTETPNRLADALSRWAEGDDTTTDPLIEMLEFAQADPRGALYLVLKVMSSASSERALGAIGAGPLQDLVANQGPEIIDDLEEEAKLNPRLRELLGGIYRLRAPDSVWDRIVHISGRDRERP